MGAPLLVKLCFLCVFVVARVVIAVPILLSGRRFVFCVLVVPLCTVVPWAHGPVLRPEVDRLSCFFWSFLVSQVLNYDYISSISPPCVFLLSF